MRAVLFKRILLGAFAALVLVWAGAHQSGEAAADPHFQPRKLFFFTAEYDTLPTPGGMGEQERIRAEMAQAIGYDTTVILPGYLSNLNAPELSGIQTRVIEHVTVEAARDPVTGKVNRHTAFEVHEWTRPGKPKIWFFAHRPGQGERTYFQNAPREGIRYNPADIEGEAFAVLSRAVAQVVKKRGFDAGFAADWHTGLLASELLRLGRDGPRVIATIHNGGYTGEFGKELMNHAALDWLQWRPSGREFEGLEYRGNVSMLKASLEHSDVILPVSRGYTEEVLEPRFTEDMAGVYERRSREWRLVPFDNPVDASAWNPKDRHHGQISHAFTADNLAGKALGKVQLQRQLFGDSGVDPNRPLFSSTSRLVDQKGWSYLAPALERAVIEFPEAQWVILGDTEGEFYPAVEALARKFPDRVKFLPFRENRSFEHPLTAYSDFNLLLSKYEPFGMTPPASKLNGTLPIVSFTGGMRSTVIHWENGFHVNIAYEGASSRVLLNESIARVLDSFRWAIRTYRDQPHVIARMRKRAMSDDPSPTPRNGELIRLVEFVMKQGPRKLLEAYGPRDPKHLPDADSLTSAVRAAPEAKCVKNAIDAALDQRL